jgi:MFS family permease
MRREWLVLVATSAIMVFASATVFSSLGVVLFAMAREFHWSDAAAGGAFTVLVLTCCVSHLAPVPLIARIGARWTIVAGGAILSLAFLVAAATSGLLTCYVAAGLLGIGFSLVANTPAIYLIAGWFADRAPRMIGVYMMIGTLGGAIGPPVAQGLIATDGGWRLYWAAMLATGLALSIMCALFIREPPAATAAGVNPGLAPKDWAYWDMLRSPRFIVIAIAMVLTQTCMITVSSVTPSHFAHLGWSAGFAGGILGLQGLVGTAATGVSGWLSEKFEPRLMLVAALIAEAVGMLLLGWAGSVWQVYAFVIAFGVGWAVSCLAVTVLLVESFGNRAGTAALATIFTFAGAAALGPSAAGMIADATGSFSLALDGLGLMLPPIACAALFMKMSFMNAGSRAPSPEIAAGYRVE